WTMELSGVCLLLKKTKWALRGQVGSGQGPRAALPGAGQGGRPGGARGPQGGPGAPQRPAAGFGSQAPASPQGLGASNQGGQQQDAFGGRAAQRPAGPADQGRQPQLPPRGGPRAELPGGDQQQRVSGWSANQAPLSRASLDAPRGHDEQDPSGTARMPRVDDRQGPGSTAEMPRIDAHGPAATGEFPRPELNQANGPQNTGQFARPDVAQQTGQYPRPDAAQQTGQYAQPENPRQTGQFAGPDAAQLPGGYDRSGGQQDTGPYVRSDVFGTQAPGRQDDGARNSGQFAAPQAYDTGFNDNSTGQHALPGRQNPAHTGQFERQQPAGRDEFGAPRQPAPQRPVRQEPEALPPASGPGDGRTPLYDTLETNWFHGAGQQQQENRPATQQPQPQAPQRAASTTGSWRTSPNDELVRQAERVRQPAAGGVTTSGLPRRVPRANLVPGTAQQQQHQAGPQVSRAPDDVRGRLTNLRRGIAQGRQAGSGQTGSFPSPTHQQER
ncbi:nitrate- and nitrite sensing domain-containing protein, partial [Streptomyces sp. NPDC004561]